MDDRQNPQDSVRAYRSPLREDQARQTRERILDALTDLLSHRRADEVSTKEIASRAGVSQPTVYRHFPDRTALLEALSERLAVRAGTPPDPLPSTFDEWADSFRDFFTKVDDFAVEATAEAVLNADPRRFLAGTNAHTAMLVEIMDRELPELTPDQRRNVTAVVRVIGSTQTWLRMREEFGISGPIAGATCRWAVTTLVEAVRRGELPDGTGSDA